MNNNNQNLTNLVCEGLTRQSESLNEETIARLAAIRHQAVCHQRASGHARPRVVSSHTLAFAHSHPHWGRAFLLLLLLVAGMALWQLNQDSDDTLDSDLLSDELPLHVYTDGDTIPSALQQGRAHNI